MRTDSSQPPPVAAVVYASKSSPDEKDSTASQAKRALEALRREGREPVAEPFTEENKSGYLGDRGPRLEAAIAAAIAAARERGRAELWVFHSSRLARGSGRKDEARSVLEIFAYLRRHGVDLRSVTDDPYVTDEAFVGMAAKMAHKYAEDMSAHIRRGKREQFAKGKRLGGPVPDGYLRIVERDDRDRVTGRRYERCPDRWPTMSRLFELALGGIGDGALARQLNREGLRTKAGGPWTRRRVQDSLTNPFYCGRVARNRRAPGAETEWAAGAHPALVDPAAWDRLQEMRAARDRAAGARPAMPGRPPTRHALARLATCARCGDGMFARVSPYKRKDGTQRRTYQCRHYAEGTGLCDQPPLDAELVDRALVAHLDGFFVDFDGWLAGVAGARGDRRALAERGLADAEAAMAALARRERALRDRWADAVEQGDARAEGLALAALDDLERDLALARARADALAQDAAEHAGPEPVDALLDFYSELSAAVRGATSGALGEVNAGLRELFADVVLDDTPEGVSVEPRWAWAGLLAPGRPGWFLGEDRPREVLLGLLADGDERIVPPLARLAAAPEGNPPYPQEFADFAKALLPPPLVAAAEGPR